MAVPVARSSQLPAQTQRAPPGLTTVSPRGPRPFRPRSGRELRALLTSVLARGWRATLTSWRTTPMPERKPVTAPRTGDDLGADTVQLPSRTERMRALIEPGRRRGPAAGAPIRAPGAVRRPDNHR